MKSFAYIFPCTLLHLLPTVAWNGLKICGDHAIFSVLENKRSKMLRKLNKRDCFCLHFWFQFLWRFLRKNWFTQEVYDLIKLNYFRSLSEKMTKMWRISQQKLIYPKTWSMILFLTLIVGGHFQRKDFKWKKIWGTELISEKNGSLYAELNEKVEASTSSYPVTGDFLQNIYSLPVTRIIRATAQGVYLVHEFSFTDIF